MNLGPVVQAFAGRGLHDHFELPDYGAAQGETVRSD
jgi:hypothetical protein